MRLVFAVALIALGAPLCLVGATAYLKAPEIACRGCRASFCRFADAFYWTGVLMVGAGVSLL